jgi:hypothetical protein
MPVRTALVMGEKRRRRCGIAPFAPKDERASLLSNRGRLREMEESISIAHVELDANTCEQSHGAHGCAPKSEEIIVNACVCVCVCVVCCVCVCVCVRVRARVQSAWLA